MILSIRRFSQSLYPSKRKIQPISIHYNSRWATLIHNVVVFVVVSLFSLHNDSCVNALVISSNAFPLSRISSFQEIQSTKIGHHVTRGLKYNNKFEPTSTISLCMAINGDDNFDDTNNDPFRILGLNEPTSELKVIKRAYKRQALKYHPDVAITQDSSPAEKKEASDRFAKINWAYQTLSGKRESNDKTYGSSKTGTGTSTGGWTPPHRRNGGYDTSSSSGSPWPGTTDWRDFMPKYDDDKEYDTGGDSFGKIFSDLFAGAAVGAAGVAGTGANLFMDFIEFLEGNVDGYGSYPSGFSSSRSSDDYDADLQLLLRNGSLEDVANEMDDTNLIVEQLQAKATSLDDEILTTNAEAKMSSRYMERIELEERVAELQAQKGVVDRYLKNSRKRLLSLQTRYKELITYGGADDSYAGGRSSSRTQSSDPSTPGSSYGSNTSTTNRVNSNRGNGGDNEESWKHEGFGGSASPRGSRGSGRRRARRSSATAGVNEPTQSYSPPPPQTESPYSTAASSFSRESVRPPPSSPSSSSQQSRPYSISGSDVPPHRRTESYASQQEKEKKRIREIKVDEEFDKLKKELGL